MTSNITIDQSNVDFLTLFSQLFNTGTISASGTTATVTIFNYSPGQDLVLTLTGTNLQIAGLNFQSGGDISDLSLSLGGTTLATEHFGGTHPTSDELNDAFAAFSGGIPDPQTALNAIGAFIYQDDTNIQGSSGDDTVYGSNQFSNTYQTDGGADHYFGGSHDDFIKVADTGNSTVDGGNGGYDNLRFDNAAHAISVNVTGDGAGIVTEAGAGGGVTTYSDIEIIVGTTFADTFNANGHNEDFTGGNGADTFNGGGNNDNVVYVKEGTDLGGTQGVIVNLWNQNLTVAANKVSGVTSSKTIAGGHALDTFGATDTLNGMTGATGTLKNDYLLGGANTRNLEGRAGNDTIDASHTTSGQTNLQGGIGADSILGSNSNDYISPGAASPTVPSATDTVNGQGGYDVLGFDGSNETSDHITVTLTTTAQGTGTVTGKYHDFATDDGTTQDGGYTTVNTVFSNMERVQGTAGNDIFNAGAGLTFTPDSEHTFDPHGVFDVVGNEGADTFNDTSGQHGGDLFVNYDAEKFSRNNGGDHIWGTEDGEHGVIVNLSGSSKTVDNFFTNGGNDIVAGGALGAGVTTAAGNDANHTDVTIGAGHAVDTYGDSDTLNGIVGLRLTDSADVLFGGTGDLYVEARAGDDYINAANSSYARLDGGAGDDTLIGGNNGNDFHGGSGNDSIVGGSGHDGVHYHDEQGEDGQGNNISGSDGVIVDLSSTDVTTGIGAVTGESGVTSIAGGQALDSFGGNDTLVGIEHVDGTQFNDYIHGGDALVNDHYELIGHQGDDTLVGGNGADNYLEGDSGNDSLVGGNQENDFVGGAGSDTIVGGTAHDGVHYDQESNPNNTQDNQAAGTKGVIVNLSGNVLNSISGVTGESTIATVAAHSAYDSYGTIDSLTGIEHVDGTQNNDYLVAGADGEAAGGNGFDLNGNGGNDTLIGGSGHDNLDGGDGNDSITAGGLYDYISGSHGTDTIDGGSDNDELAFKGSSAADHLAFVLNGAGGAGTVTGTWTDHNNTSGSVNDNFKNLENVVGSAGADTFTVNAGFKNTADASGTFWDGRGDVEGGNGRGMGLIGGAGNDTFTDNTNSTTQNGGSSMIDYNEERWSHESTYNGDHEWGTQTGEHGVIVNMSSVSHTVTAFNLGGSSANETVTSGHALDTFTNTDTITGIEAFRLTDASDVFYASDLGSYVEGHDATNGGGGDSLFGGAGVDLLSDGSGNDYIDGGAGNDNINGGTGNDTMLGGTGDDYFVGGIGTDSIDGGTGYDNIDFGKESSSPNSNVGDGLVVTLSGTNGSGTITGQTTLQDDDGNGYDNGTVNTTFTGIERIGGTNANDSFTLSSGFTNTSDANRDTYDDRGDNRGTGRNFEVVGGGGADSFTDSSDATPHGDSGGTLFVDYENERWSHPTYNDGHLWGTQAGEHGVIVNLSGSQQTVAGFFTNGGTIVDQGDDAVLGAGVSTSVDDANHTDVTVGAGHAVDTFGDSDTFSGVQAVSLTDAADIAWGDDNKDTTIYGYGGDDSITGGSGDDVLMGGQGNDTLDGGSGGFDDLDYGLESGEVQGFTDHGVIVNLSGSQIVVAGNTIAGVTGSQTVQGGHAFDGYGTTDTLSNFDGVLGTQFNDVIIGGTGSNGNPTTDGMLLVGLGGNDSIVGGANADYIIGDAGNDTLDGGGSNGGINIVGYGAEAAAANGATRHGVIVNLSAGSITVAANVITGVSTATTETSGHALDSFGGTDTLSNFQGVDGTEFGDYIVGAATSNTLNGNAGNDTLIGGVAADSINGGDGNDSIVGGGGDDTLTGGAGVDTFAYTTGNVTVTDFVATGTHDVIDLSAHPEVTDIATFISGGVQNGSDVVFTFGPGNTLTLSNVTLGDLTANDFTTGVVVNGTSGADSIDGSHTPAGQPFVGAGNDTIFGNGGNDTIFGLAGNDSIDGGAGNDSMVGGDGDDTYVVDATGDKVVEAATVGSGNDTVTSQTISLNLSSYANVENLGLFGSANLNLTGNAGNNVLTGNSGNNSLSGGAGADTMVGGAGNDTYVVDNTGDVVDEDSNGGAGTDTVQSSITFSLADLTHVLGTVENLTLTGTAAINGTGNDGANLILGNSAANSIDGGLGADTMEGGAGNDTYYVDNAGDVVNESLNGGAGTDTIIASISFSLASAQVIGSVENLILLEGSGATTATGNGLANQITGNSGDNTLDGGAGADTLTGNGGNDTYIVDNTGDSIVGGAGMDTVQANVSFSIANFGAVENLQLLGSGNFNATGNGLANVINGNTGSNSLVGGAGNDTISGGGGNDTMDGGTGADVMTGASGNDTYFVDNVGDVVNEASGGGTDTVDTALENYTLADNVEKLVLLTGVLAGNGNGLDNTITGNAGNNTIDGGVGADTMSGGAGNDTYYVDNVNDVVDESTNGGAGNDTIVSSVNFSLADTVHVKGVVENLTLALGSAAINGTGTAAANMIIGNEQNNSLVGGGGNDTLNGGLGADTMNGGAGNDTYYVDNIGDVIGTDTGGNDTVIVSIDNYTLATGLDNLTMLDGVGVITGNGNSAANLIVGNSNDNVLNGNGGNDTLNGGVGADTMNGGAGNDTYYVDNVGDVINDTGGTTNTVLDFINTPGLTYTLANGLQNLTLAGGAAINGTGNSANNLILGNTAANVIDGGTGNDTMEGGAGNDTYKVDSTGDVVNESLNGGAGNDTVISSVNFSLADTTHAIGAIENLTLTGTATIGTGNALNNILIGNSIGNNSLTGAAGDDTLVSGGAHDTLIGGAGNDTYYVNDSTDVVNETAGGGAGTDTVISSVNFNLADAGHAIGSIENLTLTGSAQTGIGNALNNTIIGNNAGDSLNGGAGNDFIIAGSGTNTIEGGLGHDILFGGSGADTFTYADADFTGVTSDTSDDIYNYDGAHDVIDLTGLTHMSPLTDASPYIQAQQVGSDVIVELNAATALSNTATGDWSQAFVIHNVQLTDLHFEFGGNDNWTVDNTGVFSHS